MCDAGGFGQVSGRRKYDLSPSGYPSLIAIAGPTGSGKSELALVIARELHGEIVNYDSVQMYRGFDIGSAKLPLHGRQRIPHHLIDVVDAGTDMTAGQFAREATHILTGVSARGKLAVLVGGTGFYLRALLDGLSPAPVRNVLLRERLTRLSERRPAALLRFLKRFDSAAASRIHANDRQKLIRAVEISMQARQPATEVQARPRSGLSGYRVLKIGLLPDRRELHDKLNERTKRMFSQGLLAETEKLLQEGVSPTAKPMLSLGYKQAAAVLLGKQTLDHALRECQTKTRQYAKRQITWFRSERDINWFAGFGSDPGIQQQAICKVADWLTSVF